MRICVQLSVPLFLLLIYGTLYLLLSFIQHKHIHLLLPFKGGVLTNIVHDEGSFWQRFKFWADLWRLLFRFCSERNVTIIGRNRIRPDLLVVWRGSPTQIALMELHSTPVYLMILLSVTRNCSTFWPSLFQGLLSRCFGCNFSRRTFPSLIWYSGVVLVRLLYFWVFFKLSNHCNFFLNAAVASLCSLRL